jgi:hypothetical protein
MVTGMLGQDVSGEGFAWRYSSGSVVNSNG